MAKIRNIILECASFFLILVLPIIALLPRVLRITLAQIVAFLLRTLKWWRIDVILTNLRACFPELSDEKIFSLCKSNIFNIIYGYLESIVAFHRSDRYIKKTFECSNFEIVSKYNNKGVPVIILLPHYTYIFMALRILQSLTPDSVGIRKKQKSMVFEKYYSLCLNWTGLNNIYQHELKKAVSVLRANKNLLLLPDVNAVVKNSVFVDFFGIKAATITSVSKLAKLGRANVVVMNFYRKENNQYYLDFEDLSGQITVSDYEKDATLINKTFEKYIAAYPDQYNWSLRRFKRRPVGDCSTINYPLKPRKRRSLASQKKL